MRSSPRLMRQLIPPGTAQETSVGRRAAGERLTGAVLVVVIPPAVRRALRPARRRVLPFLLAAQRRAVEEAPDGADRLDPAAPGPVGLEGPVAVAQEDVEGEPF